MLTVAAVYDRRLLCFRAEPTTVTWIPDGRVCLARHPADVTRRLRQKTSISNAHAFSPMPGDVDSLGPETFKVLIGFVRSHRWMFSDAVPFSKSQTNSDRLYRP